MDVDVPLVATCQLLAKRRGSPAKHFRPGTQGRPPFGIIVRLEFDEAKSARNVKERGIGFERFADMDLERAISKEDTRTEYGERRIRMFGPIDGRLHAAVITISGDRVRVISLRRRTGERSEGMRKNPSRPDAENPEWTEEDFRRARAAVEVLPKEVFEAIRRYRGQRGPQKAPTKELISLRVDRDIVDAFRATGRGWQTRANDALRAYAKKAGLQGSSRKRTKRRTTSNAKHP